MKIKNKILLLILITIIFGCEFQSEKNEKLNILWLVAEDLSPFYLNAYGDPRAHTPNLVNLRLFQYGSLRSFGSKSP